jgi:putative SOS response-associated peptidase YedK
MNARSETAHEKPAFRDAFRHRRCLIPSSGFYEWKEGATGSKQPHAAIRDGGEPHAMAGLWETWDDPVSGDRLETCTVLTCPANARLRGLHERMPVIVPEVDWSMWLDPRVEGVAPLRAVCRPDEARRWHAYPVSTRVNSVKHEGPGLLDEVMDESAGLFG